MFQFPSFFTKRNIFLSISLLLTTALFFLIKLPLENLGSHGIYFLFFAIFSLPFFWLGLHGEARGVRFLTLLILPFFFVLGFGYNFYFFPNLSFYFKLFLLGFFFWGIYSLFLIANIFNVGSGKAIPLLKTARTTNFLFTIIVSFLFSTLLFKFDFDFWIQSLIVSSFFFLITLQYLWSLSLKETINKDTIFASLLLTLLIFEVFLSFAFFPLKAFFRGTLLATFYYAFLGTTNHFLRHNLTNKVIVEYSSIVLLVLLVLLLFR